MNPGFIHAANGNFRLQTHSPCIDAGNNNFANGNADLDGRARKDAGSVDLGEYEFQSAG